MARDSVIALALVALLLALGACAAAGGAALGAVSGAALGGPPGALAGAVGGLVGACWTSIMHSFSAMFDWLGGGSSDAAPPPSAAAEAWIFGRYLLVAVVVWLLVHAITPARIGRMGGRVAQAVRGLTTRRPKG